jgi:hypothetical protein
MRSSKKKFFYPAAKAALKDHTLVPVLALRWSLHAHRRRANALRAGSMEMSENLTVGR